MHANKMRQSQIVTIGQVFKFQWRFPCGRWFAYFTMENSIFARFARAFFSFWHFEDVLVLSTTWNELFCSCVDDETIWWKCSILSSYVPSAAWFQFNSRIVRTAFWNLMTSINYWKMIAETWSDIFRWRSRFRGRRACLSSLLCSCVDDESSCRQSFNVFLVHVKALIPF